MKKTICLFLAILFVLSATLTQGCTASEKQTGRETTVQVQKNPPAKETPAYTQIRTDGTVDLSGFSDAEDYQTFFTSDYIFSFSPLEGIPDTLVLQARGWYADADGNVFLLAEERDTGAPQLLCVSPDASHIQTISVPFTDFRAREFMGAVRILEDGSFLCVTRILTALMQDGDCGRLLHIAADGTVLAETALPGVSGSESFVILDDGRIAVEASDSTCFYDAALQLLCETDACGTLLLSPKGELLIPGAWNGMYVRLDTDAYTGSAEELYAPSNTAHDKALFFTASQTEYDVYFADGDAFYGMNAGEKEANVLCIWQDSGQLYADLTILAVIDEKTLFVALKNAGSDTIYGFLQKDSAHAQKKCITLGIVDNIHYIPTDTILTNAVNRFNASGYDYYVDIRRYASSNDTPGRIPEAFTQDMLDENAPDILVSSCYARENMQIYTEKNAFADLSVALRDVLLPCALSAYRQKNGAVYAIPFNMKLSVLAAKDYVLDDDETLTLDKLYDVLDMAETNGLKLFNSTCRESLLSVAAPSFADAETGECFYNGEDFASFIRFIDNIATYTMEELPEISFLIDYTIDASSLAESIRADDFLLLKMPFYSMDAYAILKLFYDKFGFSIHGYPAYDNEIVSFDSDFDISLNAASPVQYGSMQFISYLLSDAVQDDERLTGFSFPVTYRGIEHMLAQPTRLVPSQVYTDNGNGTYRINVFNTDWKAYFESSGVSYMEITPDDTDLERLRRLFYTAEMQSLVDTTMNAILEEELSAYRAGAQTLERTQEILQSRLFIYLNE